MHSASGKQPGNRNSPTLELGVCPVCKTNDFTELASAEEIRRQVDAFYAALLNAPMRKILLAQNNLLAFPYRHGFTSASLKTLLAATGFEVVRMRGDVLVTTAGAWTRGWAAMEERIVKATTRAILPRSHSPWIEVYARAV